MWEWLLEPIDPNRAHQVGFAISWHGRMMVLAWGVIAPLAVLTARFLKVLPWQDWPRELDNQFWWRAHWIGQSVVVALTALAVLLIQSAVTATGWHGRLGYTVLALAAMQVGFGMIRGSKGGPTARAADGSLRGDHYDMTRWRLIFEFLHKSIGYLTLSVALMSLSLGLWDANAPRWMWVMLGAWWTFLLAMALLLQGRGWAVDTYQAIWGPSLAHPGNRRPSQGWGMRRIPSEEAENVRSG
ncbi:MAG: cytochrome b561 domain-containing protein [Pseudomonadota bacterium]